MITCAFTSFCAADGTCGDTAPLEVTINFGTHDGTPILMTTSAAPSSEIVAQILPPLPSGPSEPLHLLARSQSAGAMLLSLRETARDTLSATLRTHPERYGDPTGPDALTSPETACTQTFVRP